MLFIGCLNSLFQPPAGESSIRKLAIYLELALHADVRYKLGSTWLVRYIMRPYSPPIPLRHIRIRHLSQLQ
jgi:hypothetical protein